MRCPDCGFEVPAGMRCCGQWATPLAGVCPQCGFANPPRFVYCGQCAAPLATVYLAEKILLSRSALEGERKQVTVLFADLKGLNPIAGQ